MVNLELHGATTCSMVQVQSGTAERGRFARTRDCAAWWYMWALRWWLCAALVGSDVLDVASDLAANPYVPPLAKVFRIHRFHYLLVVVFFVNVVSGAGLSRRGSSEFSARCTGRGSCGLFMHHQLVGGHSCH